MTTLTITEDIADDLSTAVTLANGDTLISALNFSDDRDWIHVALRAGKTYQFTMEASGGSSVSPYPALFDGTGNLVRWVTGSPSSRSETITFTAPTSGAKTLDYYFEAADYSGSTTGEYTLTLLKEPRFGFGDIAGDATTMATLAVGGILSSNIAADADTDWIAVDLVAGTTYTWVMAQDGFSNLHSHLLLHDAGGARLADDADGARLNDSQLIFTATTTGTYFLEAATFRDPGAYQITMAEGSPYGVNDIGDDRNTTATLEDGDVVISDIAPFSIDDDEDWFKVRLVKGETYRFTMGATEGSELNSFLGIYNKNGKYIFDTDHETESGQWAGGGSGGYGLIFTAKKTGTYYVVATTAINSTAMEGHSDGGYELEMEQAISGSWKKDKMIGTEGNDWLYGGNGKDVLKGLGGEDLLFGGGGKDKIFGGDGRDWLAGDGMFIVGPGLFQVTFVPTGKGNDKLYGGDGDDSLYGGSGRDVLDGGAGSDTASILLMGDPRRVKLDLSKSGWQSTGEGKVKLVSIENLHGQEKNDVLKGNDAANTLHGGGGNDKLFGYGGNDYFNGGAGNDRLYGGDGDDVLHGASGNDELYGEAGNDIFFLGTTTSVFGGDGSDTVSVWDYDGVSLDLNVTTAQVVRQSTFFLDSIENVETGKGDDHVTGNDADNWITTGRGNDMLFGGAGHDVLNGGNFIKYPVYGPPAPYSDIMTGGADADTFVFDGTDFGYDTITDFEVGNLDEKLDFSSISSSADDFTVSLAASAGGTTRITFNQNGHYVDLQNAYFASEADLWAQVILG